MQDLTRPGHKARRISSAAHHTSPRVCISGFLTSIKSSLIVFFLLILCHNLAWDDARHWHGEDPLVHSEQQYDPVVPIRLILNLPLFALSIPRMSASNSSSNLIMAQWGKSLCLIDKSTSFDGIIVHFFSNFVGNWQLLLSNVVLNFFQIDSIVEILVNGVTQVSHTLHWHL